MLITGKSGKTASGLICLKEKNNSQGIWDMGIHPSVSLGAKITSVPDYMPDLLLFGYYSNLLIFGEDPVGCSSDPEEMREIIRQADFIAVQDYFMSATAEIADLVLPASLPFEIGGSFTNTQRVIQEFDPVLPGSGMVSGIDQLIRLLKEFGLNGISDGTDARIEALKKISVRKREMEKFCYTYENDYNALFSHGCDLIVKMFDDECI
jgi:predicted molibdopterin-dependent oxidoreductase YjgC